MTKILIDEAVVRQALEAFHLLLTEPIANTAADKAEAVLLQAAPALRQALAEAAFDKKADNARELGLSYDASVVRIDTSAERVEKEAENVHEQPAPAQEKGNI